MIKRASRRFQDIHTCTCSCEPSGSMEGRVVEGDLRGSQCCEGEDSGANAHEDE